MRTKRKKINWDTIKVTIVPADLKNPNPLNPCSHMTPKQRREEIIDISADIWIAHCREMLEKKGGERGD